MKRLGIVIICLVVLAGCRSDMVPREIGEEASPRRVLIVGESTPFKEAVVTRVVMALDTGEYYFRIAGLDELASLDPGDFGAVVLATWYSQGKLVDKRVNGFVERYAGHASVIVFYTHGGGESLPADRKAQVPVDAVSSPSRDDRVASVAEELVRLIDKLF